MLQAMWHFIDVHNLYKKHVWYQCLVVPALWTVQLYTTDCFYVPKITQCYLCPALCRIWSEKFVCVCVCVCVLATWYTLGDVPTVVWSSVVPEKHFSFVNLGFIFSVLAYWKKEVAVFATSINFFLQVLTTDFNKPTFFPCERKYTLYLIKYDKPKFPRMQFSSLIRKIYFQNMYSWIIMGINVSVYLFFCF